MITSMSEVWTKSVKVEAVRFEQNRFLWISERDAQITLIDGWTIEPGEWLIKDEAGRLYFMPEELFDLLFGVENF